MALHSALSQAIVGSRETVRRGLENIHRAAPPRRDPGDGDDPRPSGAAQVVRDRGGGFLRRWRRDRRRRRPNGRLARNLRRVRVSRTMPGETPPAHWGLVCCRPVEPQEAVDRPADMRRSSASVGASATPIIASRWWRPLQRSMNCVAANSVSSRRAGRPRPGGRNRLRDACGRTAGRPHSRRGRSPEISPPPPRRSAAGRSTRAASSAPSSASQGPTAWRGRRHRRCRTGRAARPGTASRRGSAPANRSCLSVK